MECWYNNPVVIKLFLSPCKSFILTVIVTNIIDIETQLIVIVSLSYSIHFVHSSNRLWAQVCNSEAKYLLVGIRCKQKSKREKFFDSSGSFINCEDCISLQISSKQNQLDKMSTVQFVNEKLEWISNWQTLSFAVSYTKEIREHCWRNS